MNDNFPGRGRLSVKDERLSIIGDRFKAIRESKQLTQKDVAQRMGSPTCVISDLEKGIGNPTMSRFVVLCIALEIQPVELLHRIPRVKRKKDRNCLYLVR